MHIIVCMKQVPDPEGPQDAFVINAQEKRVEPRGIPPVLSLFDENALEAALRIKDADKDARITVLSAGKRVPDAVMLKALAAGADALVKVEGQELENAVLDSFTAASVLACAIKKVGDADVILAGRQSADANAGLTGVGLAAILGLPCVTAVRKAEIKNGRLAAERVIPGGHEVVEAPLPCVVVTSNEIGELRYPAMKERRKAASKPVTGWTLADVGAQGPFAPKAVLKDLTLPPEKKRQCEIISAATAAEAGKALAIKLHEAGII